MRSQIVRFSLPNGPLALSVLSLLNFRLILRPHGRTSLVVYAVSGL
jgi:hypothetical protein